MRFSDDMRKRIADESKGKVIESMEYEPGPEEDYWVMTFTDGTEMAVRLMAELGQ